MPPLDPLALDTHYEGGFGQQDIFRPINQAEILDFGGGFFENWDNQDSHKENRPPRPPHQRGNRGGPSRKPRDEDEAECRPPSQSRTFDRLAGFKQQQRRERQIASPRLQGFQGTVQDSPADTTNMTTTTRRSKTKKKTSTVDNPDAQVPDSNDEGQDPNAQVENTNDPGDNSSAGTPTSNAPGASDSESGGSTLDEDSGEVDKATDASGKKSAAKSTAAGGSGKKTFANLKEYMAELKQCGEETLEKMKKANSTVRLQYIKSSITDNIKANIAIYKKNVEIEQLSSQGGDETYQKLKVDNEKKDKKIATLEQQVAELEALARATKGQVNQAIQEEVINWAKEEGWRTVKFLISDKDTREFAKYCTNSLANVKEFHGDPDKEAVFFLTYDKALKKGIASRRNYLTQELKKVFFDLKKDGKKPYAKSDLMKCAKRVIDFEVCL